jgi:uncharacterized protein HemY
MRYSSWARKTDSKQREIDTRLRVARLDVAMLAGALLWCTPAAWCVESEQDSGSKATEFFGNGAEINVIVHDGTGNPISSTAMVRLYRDGNIPSGEGATSHGRVRFVVTSLGEFTVVVEPAGQATLQKDVSVRSPGETQVDLFLRPAANTISGASAAGASLGIASNGGSAAKVILAPKAQEAFDKGLRALSTEKMHDAEKYVGEAARLAPGHPDVLYAQGVLYLKEKNWSDAQAALEKATQIDPSHARAFAALGMALTDQRKFEAAIAPLEKSVQLDGATANWETEFVLARAYYESARYPEALTMSKKALADAKGRAPEILLLVAQALTGNGQYAEAEETLKEFLREHGDRPEAAKARRWVEKLEARN